MLTSESVKIFAINDVCNHPATLLLPFSQTAPVSASLRPNHPMLIILKKLLFPVDVPDLPALDTDTLFRLNSTNASVCNDFVYPAPLMLDAAPAEWGQPLPPGAYILQACFFSAPRAEPQSVSASGANAQMIATAMLAGIFAVATLAGVRSASSSSRMPSITGRSTTPTSASACARRSSP